jgi:hypothetical protein
VSPRVRSLLVLPLLAAASCGLFGGGGASREPPWRRHVSDEDRARLAAVARTGRAVFEQDVAAQLATRAFLEAWPEPPPQEGGFLARRVDDGYRVSFLGGPPERPELLADVAVASSGDTSVALRPSRALGDDERAMFRARQTALASAGKACAAGYNTALLAVPGDGWDVYALAATPEPRRMVVGGHARLRVSADGAKVVERESWSSGCEVVPLSD